jgi:uncharacterized repeat protein (TIGR03803 family)
MNFTVVLRSLQVIAGVAITVSARPDAIAAHFSTIVNFPGGTVARPEGALASDGVFLYGTSKGTNYDPGNVYRAAIDGSTLNVLHFMDYPIGGFDPYGGVTLIGSRLFGVTYRGGPPAFKVISSGTVFSLNTDGSDYQILKFFHYQLGSTTRSPQQTVISDGTTLYGTTTGQLANDRGAVFRLNHDGKDFKLLHSFSGPDGSYANSKLDLVGSRLYGTTAGFSVPGFNHGTVFSLNTDGTDFRLLHVFQGADGSRSEGDLALSGSRLYGITAEGGDANKGTIYGVGLDGSGFETLHSFSTEGHTPYGGLTFFDGTLYGTTVFGGPANAGTIFSIRPDGTGYKTVHFFTGTDGANPLSPLLAVGSTLYGTTESGGTIGAGTIFAFAIPEPTAMLLALVGMPLVGCARYRRDLAPT